MKSFIVFLFLIIVTGASSFAQNVKKAKAFFDEGKLDKAKAAIDEAVTGTEANSPTAWVWKHKIYEAIGNSNVYKNSVPDAMQQGFEALKTAYNMPKGDEAMMKELGIQYTKPFNDYYIQFINNGSDKMNKEKYAEAVNEFKSALSVSHFFYEKEFITTDLDTMIVFYAGYCAMKAKDNIGAEQYFKQLYEKSARGTDIQIAYGWLTNYYVETKKDVVTAKAVCDKGLLYYPTDEYLKSQLLQIARAGNNVDEIFNQYEIAVNKPSAEFADYLSYGAELYDYLYVNDDNHKITNAVTREARMKEMLLKALQLRPASAETNYILGMYYTNKALALDMQSKTETNDQKKAELKKQMAGFADSSVKYLEMAASIYMAKTSMKSAEKEHLKSALQQLINLYKYQANPEKVKQVQEKLKNYN